jgi:hypothetical protein
MANINKKVKKEGKFVIIPRDQNTYKERFAVCNGKKLPFETPVVLSANDVAVLERQREPFQVDAQETVYSVMDKYQVDQKKAAQILQAQAQSNQGAGKKMTWRKKYILQAV